jgi:hypothetical protein
MDNINKLNKAKINIPKIVIDFAKNPNGELIIKVHYNETITKEIK